MFILRSNKNSTNTQYIGRGSHWDKIALDALKRKYRIQNTEIFITECGLGASGFPHIGSFADASRAYAIKIAAEDQGTYETSFFAYSDDLDGLRKVPQGLPSNLNEWIGVPVSYIPDHEGCHQSYGQHMTSLLLDSLSKAQIEFTHQSAVKLYSEGKFTKQISSILANTVKAGEIIKEITGQEKYLTAVPFHPICKNCGKIYTTHVTDINLNANQVSYECTTTKVANNEILGCDEINIADYSKGEGKLSWKVEFAARWDALQIDFEPYGKDILESVLVNNKISKEILGYEPPHQIRYEMFLDKGGEKISKSKGNVFTPQMWMNYGSPQSLILMTLKRIEGTRSLSVQDISQYMDELDALQALYFGLVTEKDQKQVTMLKALYEYSWWLKPPSKHKLIVNQSRRTFQQISYNLLSLLSQFSPPNVEPEVFVGNQLVDYGLLNNIEEWNLIEDKFKYAKLWSEEQDVQDPIEIEIEESEKEALNALLNSFETINFIPDEIQSTIFKIAKDHNIKPRKMFSLLYSIFLGLKQGPRLGKLITTMGSEAAKLKISNFLISK